jgi:aromatic ring-cleaving dioxygenase
MEELSQPAKELISRVLNEVGFEERMVGYWISERLGPVKTSMYSFEEVINFLNNQFPQLEFKELEKWIRVVMKDEELALKISEAIEEETNDHDRTERIRTLMQERLSQCKNAAFVSP